MTSTNNATSNSNRVEINYGRWTKLEQDLFIEGLSKHGKDWRIISELIQTRNVIQIRTHAQKYFQKLAKVTGGPVISTSRKDKLAVPDLEYSSQIVMSTATSAVSLSAKKRHQDMLLRQNSFGAPNSSYSTSSADSIMSDSDTDTANYGARKNKRAKKLKKTSPVEIDLTDNLDITALWDFTNVSLNLGGDTPCTIAAATLLIAPKYIEEISEERLNWATNIIANYVRT